LGDSLFFGGMKAYLWKYAYNYASTFDLRDFLSTYSKIDLKPFFDAWVFTPGFPHFSIDSVVSTHSGNGFDVTVFVRQKLKGRTKYADRNRLELAFMDSKWNKIIDTIQFSGVTGHKTFHFTFCPSTVMADPDEKISDAATDVSKTLAKAGEYDYPQTFCKVQVNQIHDSALVRIIHNWIAPDSLSWPHPGIWISDSRYWTVEGIFPKGFKAEGKFLYSNATGLDKTLLENRNDSLLMLYREGAGKNWKATAFTLEGSWMNGTITVANLQPGEYSLAVRESKHLFTNDKK
jgi:hypothetical protein